MIQRVFRSRDDGYTMVMVLLAFFIVSGLALVALATATRTVGTSRESQDFRAALSAAQAGAQDYMSRLNTCDTYWVSPCADSTPNDALTGWATVPGTTGTNAAQYKQELLSNPLSSQTPGVVRLKVTGRVNGVERVIVSDLSKAGFLKFLYYSDYETFSPYSTANLSSMAQKTATGPNNKDVGQNKTATLDDGTTITSTRTRMYNNTTYTILRPTEAQVRAGCQTYYYDGRSTFPRTVRWTRNNVSGEATIWPTAADTDLGNIDRSWFECLSISFQGGDTIDGPMHTNDAIRLNGNVNFKGDTTTSWPSSGVAVPAGTNLWYGTGTPQVNKPVFQSRLTMPPTNLNIRRMADGAMGGTGCLYTGPTRIEFTSNGKMKVKSPYTKATNSGCIGANPATMTEVSRPGNGVIYVQDVPASTTDPNYSSAAASCGTAQPISEYTNNTGDTYDCKKGDVFVQGTVSGRFTVASAHDVIVTSSLTYKDGVNGTDVMGLVGQNNVAVYHPYNESTRVMNMQIDAAIASVQNSFTVQNYDRGNPMGSLTVRGVIVQKFRGPVATGSGSSATTGYNKAYQYDKRLMRIPPPSFLELVDDAWSVQGFTEQDGS